MEAESMHIDFVRSGGFAGLRLTVSLDMQDLAAEQAAALAKMIESAGFFDLPEQIQPASPAPDRFEYRVTVSSPEQRHSVVVSEAAVPERLRPLLDYLTTFALTRKNR